MHSPLPLSRSGGLAAAIAVAAAVLLGVSADAASILTIASRSSGGAVGNHSSVNPSLSGDGRFVAFESNSDNLLGPGNDTNNVADVFVHDRQTQKTKRVSVSTTGVPQDAAAPPFLTMNPVISADGNVVAFSSTATNLATAASHMCGPPDDLQPCEDVFVHDRSTHQTTMASRNSDGVEGSLASYRPSISGDGHLVTFTSDADNLDVKISDTNGFPDIYVRDRSRRKTKLVSRNKDGGLGDGASLYGDISADGRFIAFQSDANNLVGDDDGQGADIFVRDLDTNKTTLISRNKAGLPANGDSFGASISADGQFIAYASYATDLIKNDANGKRDIFVYDSSTGKTSRVNLSSEEAPANLDSAIAKISADGRFVVFESYATNLVAGDDNGKTDIYVRDRTQGTTKRMSRTASGDDPDAESYGPEISGDGRITSWYSGATNMLCPGCISNLTTQTYVRGPSS